MQITIRTLGLLTLLTAAVFSRNAHSSPTWAWVLIVFFAMAFLLASFELDNGGKRSAFWLSWILALAALFFTIWSYSYF